MTGARGAGFLETLVGVVVRDGREVPVGGTAGQVAGRDTPATGGNVDAITIVVQAIEAGRGVCETLYCTRIDRRVGGSTITRIPVRVGVGIGLGRIGDGWTVIACVALSVAISVGLGRVGDGWTVIACVALSVAISVGLGRVGDSWTRIGAVGDSVTVCIRKALCYRATGDRSLKYSITYC